MTSGRRRIVRLCVYAAALLACCLCLPLYPALPAEYSAPDVPNTRLSDARSYVSNPDGIIKAQDVAAINKIAAELDQELDVEIAIVAITAVADNEPRMFATELFELWGIGKKGKDSGLLVLLITTPEQRSVTFETGYGLEGVMPDALCYQIQQQYMVPDMKRGDYSGGMRKGVEAVRDYLMASDYMLGTNSRDAAYAAGGDSLLDDEAQFFLLLFFLIFCTVGAIILYLSIKAWREKRRPRPCPRCGKVSYRFIRTRIIRAASYTSKGLGAEAYACSQCGYQEEKQIILPRKQRSSSGSDGSWGGFGDGGGFGGGGGGFSGGGGGGSWGGGSSGGGGASSRF